MTERLTDEQLRGYASAEYSLPFAHAMADELLALRARVAKLEAALLFVRKGIDRKAIKNIGVAEPLKPGAKAFDLIPLSAYLDAALKDAPQ